MNSGFHLHVWFEESGDEFYSNIVMRRHAPIRMPAIWGTRVDSNFFFTSPADLDAHRSGERDASSLVGDPAFVDPASGNFNVRSDSPALAVGFVNFQTDNFGVQKAALRRIARQPLIPGVTQPAATAIAPRQTLTWHGAVLRDIQGEEFSAFGVTRESGGIHVVRVAAGSVAERSGFCANDLIQEVGGKPVRNFAELLGMVTATSRPFVLTVIRDQRPLIIGIAEE